MSNISIYQRSQQVFEVPNHGEGPIKDLYDLIRSAEDYARSNNIGLGHDDYALWEADEEGLRVVFEVPKK